MPQDVSTRRTSAELGASEGGVAAFGRFGDVCGIAAGGGVKFGAASSFCRQVRPLGTESGGAFDAGILIASVGCWVFGRRPSPGGLLGPAPGAMNVPSFSASTCSNHF